CGLYGLKPSFGRVSRIGVHPEKSTLDCVGPIAGGMAMIERAMTIIDKTFVPAARPAACALGIVGADADEEIADAAAAALTAAGVEACPIALPLLKAAYDAGLTIMAAEQFEAFGSLCGSGLLGPDIDARLRAAGHVSSEQKAEAESVRECFRR